MRLTPPIAIAVLLLSGCSAGPASVAASWDVEAHAVRLTVTTEGKNSFTARGQSCTAKGGASCQLVLPAADLPSGWSDVVVETKRRTGMDGPLTARVFLGDDAFTADCEALELPGSPARWDVRCAFPDGFSGELAGRPMTGGRGEVSSLDIPRSDDSPSAVDRPLIRASLPLEVVNRAGSRWPRDLPVVAPVPVVQLRLEGWQADWYDAELPLRLRAEAGAEVVVDGRVVAGADGEEGAVHTVPIQVGANRVQVEARKEGLAPARHELVITGKQPATPLYLDTPRALEFTTRGQVLRVVGRSLPHAKVYVDTRRVPELIDGRFDVEVPLVEGPNEIQVLAVVDADGGHPRRPPTKVELLVTSTPNPNPLIKQQLRAANPVSSRAVLEQAAQDAWSQAGEDVGFTLRVEDLQRTPVGEGCHVRIEGLLCPEEVRRSVQVGFEPVFASACGAEEYPAVVDLQTCPKDLQEGARIRVAGAIRGAIGGRWGTRTVERPQIDGADWEPAPWVEPPPPVEGG